MIEIDHVSKVFGSGEGEVRALEDVTLNVAKGEIVGVIGTSGAGKSTLIRCVNLLERPTAGTVTVDGHELTGLDAKELRRARLHIGMIFQHFNLLDSRTAADNIAFPLELAGMGKAERKSRVAELLELVELADRGQAYPSQLSGGQKQRVAIARALAASTKVLLCDEATSALDPETTRSILDLLRRLNQEFDLTLMIITHSMTVVSAICDTVALMANGRIVQQGSLAQVAALPDSPLVSELLPKLPGVPNTSVPGSVIDITLAGASAEGPVFSTLVREFDVDVNILGGAVTDIGGKRFGRFRLELPVEEPTRSQIIAHLESIGAAPEVAA